MPLEKTPPDEGVRPAERPAVLINRSKLRPPSRDIKPNRKEQTLARYEADIRKRGILVPLEVLGIGDLFEILNGYTRYLAGLRADLQEFPCQIITGTMTDLQKLFYRLKGEEFSTRQDREERALAWLEAKKLGGLSNRNLAEELGLVESTISKALRPLEVVPEDIRAKFGPGKGRAIYALATLNDEASIRTLGIQAAQEGWNCVRVERESKRLRFGGDDNKGKRKKVSGPHGMTFEYREGADAKAIIDWLQLLSNRFKKGLELEKDQDTSPIFAHRV